eukprot:SAG11_NODE_23157_length_394_cov_0.701695_1_plen_80_part_01
MSLVKLNPNAEWPTLWRSLTQLGWSQEQGGGRARKAEVWFVPPMTGRFESSKSAVERRPYYESEKQVRAYIEALRREAAH